MLNMIAAVAHCPRRPEYDRLIGVSGDMPWVSSLPADMRWFRQVTTDHTVVMGRKTWESIPRQFRPLAGRRNRVVTSDTEFQPDPDHELQQLSSGTRFKQQVEVCRTLREALNWDGGLSRQIFVIGGQEIYRQSLPMADRLYLTRVPFELLDMDRIRNAQESDLRYFPVLGPESWRLVSSFTTEQPPRSVHGDRRDLTFEVWDRT